MNLRNVLKVYGLQRQFNDDESALLKTLQSLNDTERDLLVESLSPAQKKSSKKSAGKGAGKSQRASGMAAQLNKSLQSQRQVTTDADDDASDSTNARCQFIRADNKPCHLLPDHNIHHMTTANEYHLFASLAQSAQEQSTIDSSETGKAAASNVHRAGG